MDPELVLEDTTHGLQVTYQGRRLYGRRPVADATRRIASRTLADGTLVVWPSPVLWHGWRELAGKLGNDSAVLALESDPVLLELARRRMPVDPRLILTAPDPREVISALRRLGEHRLRRVAEVTTTASSLAHRDRYRAMTELLDRELRVFWQNRMTLAAMGRLWVRNALLNLPLLPLAEPEPRICGPTIVCGAGPSLERAIGVIRAACDSCTLVAVDTALPILESHGIRPDLVVALEGQLANAYDFLPVSNRAYVLLADLTSAPSVARLHPRCVWTITEFAPFTLVGRLAGLPGVSRTLPPLGSVGVSAVMLAVALGGAPVVCAGLDFAVLPGATHARGAPSYRSALAASNRLQPVPDPALTARTVRLAGTASSVSTTLVLKSYADELSRIVANRPDVYAIDPFGLDYGAAAISADEAIALLKRTGRRREIGALPPARDVHDARKRLVDFARRELALVECYGRLSGRRERLPAALDYLACEIPDRITSFAGRVAVETSDPSVRARLRVAADYYRERWVTVSRILGL